MSSDGRKEHFENAEDFQNNLAENKLRAEEVDRWDLENGRGKFEVHVYKIYDKDGEWQGYQNVWIKVGEPEDGAPVRGVGEAAAAADKFDPGGNADIGEVAAIQWFTTKNGKPPADGDYKGAGYEIMALTGLGLDPDTYLAGASNSNSEIRYRYMVSLYDGNLKSIGSKFDDRYLEVGEGGAATIKGKNGNDTVWVWHEKNVTFDGGDGKDTIRFEYQIGFDPQPAQGATVDLAAGTGINPHGGSIKLKNVENVVGQFGASNDISGDGKANAIRGGTHADTLLGRGGNDSIYVKYNESLAERATHADGGKGKDTLTAELTYMEPFIGSGFEQKSINLLDLTNQANNTGTFKGGSFENFEVIKVVQDFNTLFHFIGSGAAEKVYGTGYEDDLDGGGGNDLLAGGFAADELTGGAGRDIFWFRYATDSNAAAHDTISDFSHVEHDRIDLSKIVPGKLDFVGGKNFSGDAVELRVVRQADETRVEADTNGDRNADFVLLLDGGPKLVAADFIL